MTIDETSSELVLQVVFLEEGMEMFFDYAAWLQLCVSQSALAWLSGNRKVYVYGEYDLNIGGLTVAVVLAGPGRKV